MKHVSHLHTFLAGIYKLLQDDEAVKKAEMAGTRVKQLLANAETEYQLQSCHLSDFISFMSNPLDLVIRMYSSKYCEAGKYTSELEIKVLYRLILCIYIQKL